MHACTIAQTTQADGFATTYLGSASVYFAAMDKALEGRWPQARKKAISSLCKVKAFEAVLGPLCVCLVAATTCLSYCYRRNAGNLLMRQTVLSAFFLWQRRIC